MQPDAIAANLCDGGVPASLPEKEGLDRLDALLSDMLARAQAELERLTPKAQP